MRPLAAADLGLVAIALSGTGSIWPIYALVVVIGTSRAFANPALQALLPTLVPRPLFGSAIAWNASLWQSASILGPAAGGFLYMLGPAAVFGAAAASFALASALVVAIRFRPAAVTERPPVTWATLSAGLSYIRSQPVVLGAISLDLVAVLLGGATALLPIFAAEILHVGPLGPRRIAKHASGRCGGHRHPPRPIAPSNAMPVSGCCRRWPSSGVAITAFGLSTSLPLSMACLFVTGAADMISVYVRQTFVQGETPDSMRGRVSAVNTVFIGASNELGEFESGTLAAVVGAVPAVVARRARDDPRGGAVGPLVPGAQGAGPAVGGGVIGTP